ncbi:hypothetical protein AC477_00015 [miscellaneous Crenarchaeota group-1 archaeon SG8-32-1]|uniref:Uncharacterized protein n=1 Tax=miscellaneous Crenarchaeota group-1 archaeon SG8-32-1 TaxID=1685124 RepID=A0A0M0C1U5_9ARCH|nr:MAG: hypothetical protein AC477_00015 [miscellaneous Crenarchaeota group-1 archaeon SG8-32-1]
MKSEKGQVEVATGVFILLLLFLLIVLAAYLLKPDINIQPISMPQPDLLATRARLKDVQATARSGSWDGGALNDIDFYIGERAQETIAAIDRKIITPEP